MKSLIKVDADSFQKYLKAAEAKYGNQSRIPLRGLDLREIDLSHPDYDFSHTDFAGCRLDLRNLKQLKDKPREQLPIDDSDRIDLCGALLVEIDFSAKRSSRSSRFSLSRGFPIHEFTLHRTKLTKSRFDHGGVIYLVTKGLRMTDEKRHDLSQVDLANRQQKINLADERLAEFLNDVDFNGATLDSRNLMQLTKAHERGHAPLTQSGKIDLRGANIILSPAAINELGLDLDLFQGTCPTLIAAQKGEQLAFIPFMDQAHSKNQPRRGPRGPFNRGPRREVPVLSNGNDDYAPRYK